MRKIIFPGTVLKQHQEAVHLRLKPFACPMCDDKSFSQNGNLERHIREFHLGILPYNCKHCGGGFAQKSTLDRHMMNLHKDGSYI